MKRFIHLLLAFPVFLLSGCQQSDMNVTNSDEVKEIIAQKWARYIEAANAKDADEMVKIWNQDMRLLSDPGGAEDVRSIEAHRELAEVGLSSVTVVSLEVEADEVSLTDQTTAVEIGTWKEEFAVDFQEANIKMYGAYLGIWKRQEDGDWLLYRFIRNRHDFVNPTFEEALSELE